MIILGIETSCDETAIAVVEAPSFKVLGNALHSQVAMHTEFGGVVPNLAKREHIKNLPVMLELALRQANMGMDKIDAIAVTVGPGLEPALWTGISFAQELREKYKIPLIPTNHMGGHIASVLLNGQAITFPALALLISGGHTELVLMQNWENKKLIGETKDDAVGEAFDKVARMLGLPYPGGPEISALAEKAQKLEILNSQNNKLVKISLPRPMLHSGDYNFSFSGLKTAVLYKLRDEPGIDKPSLAREFEDACADVLVAKVKKALEEFQPKTLIIGGGVIANKHIRKDFENMVSTEFPDINLYLPEKALTTDNAVMIAMAGYLTSLSGESLELKAQGKLKFSR